MTENKRRSLEVMRSLGFEPCGKTWHNDKHEKCACACGFKRAHYRHDLARLHRQTCNATHQAPNPADHPMFKPKPVVAGWQQLGGLAWWRYVDADGRKLGAVILGDNGWRASTKRGRIGEDQGSLDAAKRLLLQHLGIAN